MFLCRNKIYSLFRISVSGPKFEPRKEGKMECKPLDHDVRLLLWWIAGSLSTDSVKGVQSAAPQNLSEIFPLVGYGQPCFFPLSPVCALSVGSNQCDEALRLFTGPTVGLQLLKITLAPDSLTLKSNDSVMFQRHTSAPLKLLNYTLITTHHI